jgi:hypothetical protein
MAHSSGPTRSSSKYSSASGRFKAVGRSGSSRGTGAVRTTLVWVELETRSTSTAVLLTFHPAIATWLKRLLLALLAWAMTVTVGSSMWTFAQGIK